MSAHWPVNRLLAVLASPVQLGAEDNPAVQAASAQQHPTIITFDPPGSVTTLSFAINPAGAITGAFIDASGVLHGFLRAPDGTFTTFDAPGAGTGPGQGTVALSNNPAGAITGYYTDGNNVSHGFLRIP